MRGAESGLTAINRGFYISALVGVRALRRRGVHLPAVDLRGHRRASPPASADHAGDPRLIASVAVAIGVVLAGVILWVTGYFTGTTSKPTLHVARTTLTGAATVVLSGIGVGFESAVYTAGIIAAAICGVFLLAGGSIGLSLFLIALAGCGLLTTVGVIVAMDTFGPVSDNAQGIAEMSGDVTPGGRADPHRPRRGRQHHQGRHQGHRDRDGRARRDRAVRLLRGRGAATARRLTVTGRHR